MKLKTSRDSEFESSIENDLVSQATDICCAYTDMLAEGLAIKELDQVVANIEFCRDTIKANGAKWFVENCDTERAFEDQFGLEGLNTNKYIVAGTEGLGSALKAIWEKIKAFFVNIWNWIKSLFSKDPVKKVEENEAEAKKDNAEAEAAVKENPEVQKEIPKEEVSKANGNRLVRAWNSLKDRFSRKNDKVSTESLSGSVRPIEGAFPTLHGLSLHVTAFTELVGIFIRASDEYEHKVKIIPSLKAEEFESAGSEIEYIGADLIKKVSDLFNKYDNSINNYLIESKDPISLEKLEIMNYSDGKKAISYLNSLKDISKKLVSTAFKFQNTTKLAGEYTEQSLKKFGATDENCAKFIITYGRTLAKFEQDCAKGISEFVWMSDAISGCVKDINKAIKNATKRKAA